MVVNRKYKRSELEDMTVKDLLKVARQSGLHGTALAGATQGELVEAILSGKLPDKRDRFTIAMSQVLEIVVDAVMVRLKKDEKQE